MSDTSSFIFFLYSLVLIITVALPLSAGKIMMPDVLALGEVLYSMSLPFADVGSGQFSSLDHSHNFVSEFNCFNVGHLAVHWLCTCYNIWYRKSFRCNGKVQSFLQSWCFILSQEQGPRLPATTHPRQDHSPDVSAFSPPGPQKVETSQVSNTCSKVSTIYYYPLDSWNHEWHIFKKKMLYQTNYNPQIEQLKYEWFLRTWSCGLRLRDTTSSRWKFRLRYGNKNVLPDKF